MAKKPFNPEQIVALLRPVEAGPSQEKTIAIAPDIDFDPVDGHKFAVCWRKGKSISARGYRYE